MSNSRIENNKFKVGGIYKCGDNRVKIVYEEPLEDDGGLGVGYFRGVGVTLLGSGFIGCLSETGLFDINNGNYTLTNGNNLHFVLEEIEG